MYAFTVSISSLVRVISFWSAARVFSMSLTLLAVESSSFLISAFWSSSEESLSLSSALEAAPA